ncbi:MAG: hypothetical protein KF773_25410 [Deltaproteobacteria bacterium]|nr:hypothetical protein [Deltaproteobacteria bacterium]
MRRLPILALALALTACGPGPDDGTFGFAGELRDHPQRASVISLWVVGTADPPYLYKFGDGTTVVSQFDMSYRSDPPVRAVNADGIGIAMMGLLPGLATLPEGETSLDLIRLDGISADHAVVWKRPGATSPPAPTWAAAFPDGFSCAQCVRGGVALDTLQPVDCTFVLLQAPAANQCVYY